MIGRLFGGSVVSAFRDLADSQETHHFKTPHVTEGLDRGSPVWWGGW